MSGWWIMLNDIRINAAAQTEGDPLMVVRALVALYEGRVTDDEFDEED